MEKICPFKMIGMKAIQPDKTRNELKCHGKDCQFWTAYYYDDGMEFMCAIKAIAKKI